jgi:hypothetical protein
MKARTAQTQTPTMSIAYRSYLIRFSALTHDNGVNRIWIEKDGAFIGWATSDADARNIINMLTGE